MRNNKFDASQHQVKVTTTKGLAQWASLAIPKKWNDDDKGNYQISLIVSRGDAQPLIDICTTLQEKMRDIIETDGKAVRMSPYNPWKETEDGKIEFRFKKPFYPANDKYPATRPVTTYMPDGTKVDWDSVGWAVGNGSTVQIGGYARPYYVGTMGLGVSLRLNEVKIHDLTEYTTAGSDDHGFSSPVGTDSNTESSTRELDGQPSADF